jgi:hypothetical protein
MEIHFSSFIMFVCNKWLEHFYEYVNLCVLYRCLYFRQGRYWQIAKHGFLVAWNAIKMRYSSMVFMFTSETWCEIDANFLQCAS